MSDFEGETRYAKYFTFFVGSPADKYRLTIGGYSGDAGGAKIGRCAYFYFGIEEVSSLRSSREGQTFDKENSRIARNHLEGMEADEYIISVFFSRKKI